MERRVLSKKYKMEIINLTPNVGVLTKDGEKYEYNLGTIPQGVPITFILSIENEQIVRTQYGCQSCTTGSIDNGDKNTTQTVTYNSAQFGEFQKPITIHLLNGNIIQLIFKGTSN
jgi:hypothetical protein